MPRSLLLLAHPHSWGSSASLLLDSWGAYVTSLLSLLLMTLSLSLKTVFFLKPYYFFGFLSSFAFRE